jgi:hypothetical protein
VQFTPLINSKDVKQRHFVPFPENAQYAHSRVYSVCGAYLNISTSSKANYTTFKMWSKKVVTFI